MIVSPKTKLKKMKASFNFVLVSDFVYEPDWAPFVSQDIPFKDGVRGEIKI